MYIIFEHLIIFFQISLICLFLSLSGFILKKSILNLHDIKNFEENGIFGFLFIGFVSLVINFLYPLNIYINNILFILIIFSAYKLKFFNQRYTKLLKFIFCASSICYVFIIYANVNTPDALLYHLPYSKIINEHKIIIGLSNIHSRFGHISIFQYISSFFYNSIFSTNGILIPLGLLVSFFLIFAFKLFKVSFKIDEIRIKSYFIFLILMFSLYSFNRYSGYGNDAQVHIYYFLTIFYLLDFFIVKKSLLTFQKLSLVCLFTFLIKPFYIISLLIPLIVFFIIRKNFIIIKSKFFIFSFFLIFFWLLKNILTTGCFIYPIKTTCYTELKWYDQDTELKSINGEAWAKSWPNRIKKNVSLNEFNKDFNWLSSWYNSHLLVILEKLLPILIFIFLNILFLFFTKCLKKNSYDSLQKFFLLILLINFISVLLWFIKFPIYRYGLSYIYILIILIFYFIYIKYINFEKIRKYYNFFITCIFILFSGIIFKNINRVANSDLLKISPFMFDSKSPTKSIKVYNKENIFTHYTIENNNSCGYSISPCTYKGIQLKKDNYLGYKIYYNY